MSDGPSAPPGWYPQEDGDERYWDGSGWTDQTRPTEVDTAGSDYLQRRRARRIGLGIVAALFVVAFVVDRVRGGGEDDSTSGSTFLGSQSSEVVYELEGSVSYAEVTIETPTGTEQLSPDVPLVTQDGATGLTYTFPAGHFVYIAAQKPGEAGTITCRIKVNGRVVSENTSSSGFGIATCQGTS